MQAVNLLTYEHPGVRSRLPAIPKPSPRITLGIVSSLLAVGLGAAYFTATSAVGERQRELAGVTAEERALVARAEGAGNERALVDREQRDAALRNALVYRIPWDQVLRDVARVLPAGASVTSLSAQLPELPAPAADAPPPDPAAADAPTGLVLNGVALTQPTVALVLDRLELVPVLVGVQLQSSTETKVGDRTARAFVVAASIRAKGATP